MAASNAVFLSNRDVESVATKVVQELGYECLNPEKLQIVTGVLRGHDMFGVSPPSDWLWENSLFCLPAFCLRQGISKKRAFYIVLVLFLLTAIMQDQVNIATQLVSHNCTAKF